jgi:hypothetical protein
MAEPKTIDVYAIGSEVLLDGRVSARIVTIRIEPGTVVYECVYWDELARRSEWVEAWEILPDGEKTRTARVNPVL